MDMYLVIRKKVFTPLLALLLSTIFIATTASARVWSDLHEEDEKLFGSEKELKYNPDMFFLQRESWEDHYSFMFLWLMKYTDYPRYNSTRILPFYYGLNSKIDNRSLSFIPFALTYWEKDGAEKYKINPLFVAGSSVGTNGDEDNYSFSWLHGYTYTKRESMDQPERTWWAPIVPLIYRNSDSSGGHMNIAWLLDYAWKRDKNGDENITRFWFTPLLFHEPGNDGYTNILPPVFLYNRYSNGEYWMSLIPFFMRSKDKVYSYDSINSDKQEYEDLIISPLFYSDNLYKDKWGGEKRSSSLWFPIIPLYYSYDEPGVESHTNIAWLIDWHNNAEGKTDRFWFMPFLFHQPGDDGYTHSLPPVFLYNRHNNGEYWLSLFPLFLRSKDKVYSYDSANSGKQEYEDLIISPLFYSDTLYKDKWGGEKKFTEFWAPIIPLYYSYDEPGVESHKNIAWLIDWHNNAEGKTDRFWFMPFLFHKPGDDGYTHSLPPVFLYNRHSSGEYWLSLFPLFMRSKDKVYSYDSANADKQEYEDLIISPFFYSGNLYKDKWNGEKRSSSFWFPIIPLYYSYDEPGVESHTNIAGLIDWHNNAEGKMDRFWFMPFYFSNNDTYRHILPPLYISLYYSEDDNYSHLFPFYVSSRSNSTVYNPDNGSAVKTKERMLLTPVSGYSSVKSTEGTAGIDSESYWFPIIPLYYHSKESKGSHTNLLWAFDWARDSSGDMSRFFFIPFVFHQPGEGGYRFYFPFYFRPSGWSEQKGVSYSPLYYHRWSEDEDTKWSWLIHYKSSDFKTGEYLNIWPLYYHHTVPSEGETTWFMPIYYHHDSLQYGGYFARIAAPFYWNFETEKRDTTLILPWSFETKKKNKKDSLYINIFGLSRSIASGVNPVIDAGLGFNQKGLYVDMDVSWLVDVWSVSTRFTIPMNKDNKPETEKAVDTASGDVALSKKSGVNRESSINFWGWHLLFGLVAYEQADSKRHFRWLPLSWITWDENSDEKIKVIFNYISYKEDETEYLVFFPFYGYQRQEESYRTGYMLNAFWHEYDHERQMNEYSVLWPFINKYDSPAKSGWRVLPVVWYKNRIENDISHTSTITPLYLDMHSSTVNNDETTWRLNLSPLHFYRYNDENNEKSKLWFSIIPFIYYDKTETVTKYTIPVSDETNFKKDKFPVETPQYSHASVSDTVHWFLPFYYMSETENADEYNGLATSDYTLIGLPLLYYHSETEKNSKTGGDKKTKGSLFVMGYYNEFTSESNSSSILFGLYESEKYPVNGDYSYSLLYGLFNVSDMNGNYENYFRPFYYYGNDNGVMERSALMGLYRGGKNQNNGDSSMSLLYSIFKTSLTHYTYSPEWKPVPVEERDTWLIPFFYYSSIESADASKKLSISESYTLLHYRESVKTSSEDISTTWFPILPLVYYRDRESEISGLTSKEKELITPLFFSEDIKNSYSESFTLWMPVIPLIYYTSEESTVPGSSDRDKLMLSPLISFTTDKTSASDSYTLWAPIIPLFFQTKSESAVNGKEISEFTSLSLLHYTENIKGTSNDSFSFWAPIIPLIYYSTDNDSTHYNFFWFADYEKDKKNSTDRLWFLPLVYSKTGDDGYFHIAPLYFSDWDEKANDYTYIICGLYLNNKPGYSRQNFLYLYDHISDSNLKHDEYSFVFNTFEYDIDPEIKRIKAFWGILADAEWDSKGYDIDALLYLASLEGEGDYFHSRFIPLWYYESDKDTHTLFIPPALTWDSEDSNKSRLQLWALGALWFRNYDPAEKSDLRAALIGIPYYKYQTAERGYESQGSVWGLLWEYETEEETGFKKFSLLKFVYKRVEMEGEVTHKVLGVSF